MGQGCRCNFNAAQHSCDFLYSAAFIQGVYMGAGSAGGDGFGYTEMMIGEFGYLRQVCDAYYLMMMGQVGQFLSDNFRHTPPDSGVDFIEDDCFHGIDFSQYGFDCQNHSGKLTPGSNGGQWFEGFPDIG